MAGDSGKSSNSPLANTAPLIEKRSAPADAIPESSSRASDTHSAAVESSTVYDPNSHDSNLNRYDATPPRLSSNHRHDSKTSPSSATREWTWIHEWCSNKSRNIHSCVHDWLDSYCLICLFGLLDCCFDLCRSNCCELFGEIDVVDCEGWLWQTIQ